MLRILFLSFIISINLTNSFAQAPIQPAQRKTIQQPRRDVTAILGAFPPEVSLLHEQIQNKKESYYQNTRFTEGTLNGRKVVLAQTGIGKVNAASITTLMLDHFQPAQVVFTGIAGGINPQLHPGDLVIATRVAYHDYGTITPDSMLLRNTRNPFTMEENPAYFTCDSGLVTLAANAARKVTFTKINMSNESLTPSVITGTIVTGDVFVASDKATDYLNQRLQADATEMEGAAIGQICWQQQVPFIVIRSMSDNANNMASVDVKTFYQVAANNSAALVKEIAGLIGSKK